ncbi:hypothetical protein UT300005_09740 [Clostridium sp. CTA-5]
MLEFSYCNNEQFNNINDFFILSLILIYDVYNVIIPSSIQNRRNILKHKF